jgi:hypothetical protein
VFFDKDNDITPEMTEKVKHALVGERRIGRSRSAQYGLVDIEFMGEKKSDKREIEPELRQGENVVLVYADSRLIFFDAYGLPAFRPEAKDFGFPSGEIDRKKSQTRTFQYAPWNFTRQARDTDRCGIEKGSVFYITLPDSAPIANIDAFVGSYKNEGFGKVIFNPRFLDVSPQSNGQSQYRFEKAWTKAGSDNTDGLGEPQVNADNINLFSVLAGKAEKERQERKVYQIVNDFVAIHHEKFTKDSFASQWGSIRQIAMQHSTKAKLKEALFTKKDASGKECAYLTHGVAKDKWEERGRFGIFKKIFDDTDENIIQMVIINVAAEMAKIARRK